MNALKKMKNLPLVFGILLIMVWGASKKTIFQIEDTLCLEHTAKLSPSYVDQLDKLTCLTNTSWEQFYRTARPILPEIISDQELEFVYHFLQDPNRLNLGQTAQKDKLKVLLLFSSVVNPLK